MSKVIVKPVISEKSLQSLEKENKYVFVVGSDMNKIQIRKFVEEKYSVKVKSVRIVNVLGKYKVFGRKRIEGKRDDYKKAYVTVMPGQSISDFVVN